MKQGATAIQVDINEAEPLFLKGHTARSGQEMSPVRVVKNPDGSMQRAALTQTALAKERREIKRQHERREMEAVPTEMSKPWEDPLAQSERRVFASCNMCGSHLVRPIFLPVLVLLLGLVLILALAIVTRKCFSKLWLLVVPSVFVSTQ